MWHTKHGCDTLNTDVTHWIRIRHIEDGCTKCFFTTLHTLTQTYSWKAENKDVCIYIFKYLICFIHYREPSRHCVILMDHCYRNAQLITFYGWNAHDLFHFWLETLVNCGLKLALHRFLWTYLKACTQSTNIFLFVCCFRENDTEHRRQSIK